LQACTLWGQQTVGLLRNDSLSLNGYTLFCNGRYTFLVDNCGAVVNQWTSDHTSQSGFHLLENGDLLRSCLVPGTFNGGGLGGRIERHNWEGQLIWSYEYASEDYHQHHDICPMPNGNILVLAWERRSEQEALAAGRQQDLVTAEGLWPEHIVELAPVGADSAAVVWEWHLWDHLVQDKDPDGANYGIISDHPERVDINYLGVAGANGNAADWIHANGIDYHPELDQIAISSRTFGEIWIIDHSTTSAEAAGTTGGYAGKGGDILYRWGNPSAYGRGDGTDVRLWGPHHITWVREAYPNAGDLLVFNNGIGRPGGNHSSVERWTPPLDTNTGTYLLPDSTAFGPDSPDWTYSAEGFYSGILSGAQALENGNILVCEGVKGRFFEITPAGQIVWEYRNPWGTWGPVSQGQTANFPSFRALRYATDHPAFENKDLQPGLPVELDPWPSDCTIHVPTSTHVGETPARPADCRLVGRQLHLSDPTNPVSRLALFSLGGQCVYRRSVFDGTNPIDLSELPAGYYFLLYHAGKNASPRTMPLVLP
jgi:hypothetical protein